jgi:hypothetical protein
LRQPSVSSRSGVPGGTSGSHALTPRLAR